MPPLWGGARRLQRREPLRGLFSSPWTPPSTFDKLLEIEHRAFGASPQGVAELWIVVGVVMAWLLPGSVMVHGCAMLLSAVVL